MGTSKEKVVMSWSGGKDSCMALFTLLSKKEYEVVSLLTTVAEGYDRISHHGVRAELLKQQAESLDIPLHIIYLPDLNCTNAVYESIMKKAMLEYKTQNVLKVVFGDIFLEDLRAYRENNLAQMGMKALFPLWKRDTTELALEFIELGFRSKISCLLKDKLGENFAGREFDRDFLFELPNDVDSCGENGEFHSFVYEGPILSERIKFDKGEVVFRENRFYFCDLVP